MSITNGLCTLDDVKNRLHITDTNDDASLESVIEAASRLIEGACDRQFWLTPAPTARTFIATTQMECGVDDFATETGLIVQTDWAGDGTFSTTWNRADFQLEPLNALEHGSPWPFTTIRAIRSLWFPIRGLGTYLAPYVQALVKVTAQWGWTSIPLDVKEATIVQAIYLSKADDAPFGATAFTETGIMRLRAQLHPKAELLLQLGGYMEAEVICL
jgi:hypothetical protein